MPNVSALNNIEVDTNTPKAAIESVARLAYLSFHPRKNFIHKKLHVQ